jgi:hypothetical protein
MRMNMAHRWNVTDVKNLSKRKEKNLSRSYFVHRRYHMDWPGIESAGLCGWRPATNRQSHGTASANTKTYILKYINIQFVQHREHCASLRGTNL